MKKLETKSTVLLKHHLKALKMPCMDYRLFGDQPSTTVGLHCFGGSWPLRR